MNNKRTIIRQGFARSGGPVAYLGIVGFVEITWELRATPCGPEFSASAGVYESLRADGRLTGMFSGGQIVEEVAKAIGSLTAKRIAEVWRGYHLNSLVAGLPDQMAALKDFTAPGLSWFTEACQFLRERGLYECPVPEGTQFTSTPPADVLSGKRGYRFGEGWVYRPIPASVMLQINNL